MRSNRSVGTFLRLPLPARARTARRHARRSRSDVKNNTTKYDNANDMLRVSRIHKMNNTNEACIRRGDDKTTSPVKVFAACSGMRMSASEAGRFPVARIGFI